MKKLLKTKLFIQILIASLLATLATAAIVSAATTIGANISTSGNIITTGYASIGTTTSSSKLDIQGDLSVASTGDELAADSTGATCSADGDCVTKSVLVTSGTDYVVLWTQSSSIGNNGNVTPYIGTSAGFGHSIRNGAQLTFKQIWQVPQTSDNKVHLNLAAGAGGGRI